MSVSSHPLLAVGPESLHGNAHYLQALLSMAQAQPMRLLEAVYSSHGERLGEKGAAFDNALYLALVHQPLRRPIDEALEWPTLVDIPAIEAEAMRQCEAVPLSRMLAHALGEQRWRLLAPLSDMTWSRQASFKLTVMRHRQPALYAHSLTMVLVAIYLGVCESLDDEQLACLAAAALLHDTGMLFLDPSWADAGHRLSQTELQQLSTHSLMSMLVVRAAGVYPPAVEMAVLEHHECMDGSGYPRNAGESAISPLGRILMLAEVVSAFFDKYAEDQPAQRLSLVLRLNRRRYHAPLVEHVHRLLRLAPELVQRDALPVAAEVRYSLVLLSTLMDHWQRLYAQLPAKWQLLPCGRAGMFLALRIASLESALAEAGSLPRQQMAMLHLMRADPDAVTEQALINREALWQLQSCVHNCLRRWPQVELRQDAVARAVSDWIGQAQTVLDAQRQGGRPAFFP